MEIEKKTNIALLYDFYSAMLSERQSEIMQLYYGDDLSLSEVAEITGITRQGVRDAIKKSENILVDCEEKLGLYERHRTQQKTIKEVVAGLKKAESKEEIERYVSLIEALIE